MFMSHAQKKVLFILEPEINLDIQDKIFFGNYVVSSLSNLFFTTVHLSPSSRSLHHPHISNCSIYVLSNSLMCSLTKKTRHPSNIFYPKLTERTSSHLHFSISSLFSDLSFHFFPLVLPSSWLPVHKKRSIHISTNTKTRSF